MRPRRNWPRTGRAYLLALIPLLFAVAYTLFLHAIRPILFDHAENYVVHEASFALYDVLTDTVYENRAEYANLVQFERDSEQNVDPTCSVVLARIFRSVFPAWAMCRPILSARSPMRESIRHDIRLFWKSQPKCAS